MGNPYDEVPEWPEGAPSDEVQDYYEHLVEIYAHSSYMSDEKFAAMVLEELHRQIDSLKEWMEENPPPEPLNHCPTCRCVKYV